VASLAALVASLSGSVERATTGGGAVAGDVSQLAASVALHGLGLAIAGKVVRSSAFVAGSGAGTAGKATAAGEATGISTTSHGRTATKSSGANRVGARASKVTGLAAVVATTAGAGPAQAKSRAVGLDMAKSLAVVALLSLGGTGKRTAVGLVAGLLAVVAEPLRRGANLGIVANVATLVAGSTRER
jgi:hypothetical protein